MKYILLFEKHNYSNVVKIGSVSLGQKLKVQEFYQICFYAINRKVTEITIHLN